jgi:tetratricopeptide (TPR) repeat protein
VGVVGVRDMDGLDGEARGTAPSGVEDVEMEYVLTDEVVIDHHGYAGDPAVRRRKGERNAALLRGAIAREPEEGYYPFKLGQYFLAEGDLATAVEWLGRARALASRLRPPPRYLAGVYQSLLSAYLRDQAGDAAECAAGDAVRVGVEATAYFPDHPWLWYLAGRAYEAAGQAGDAAAAYQRSAGLHARAAEYALDPKVMVRPHARLGRLALAAGDVSGARAAFGAGLGVSATDGDALLGLAEAHSAAGDGAAAAAVLERYLGSHPEQDSVCAWLGTCRRAAGDAQGAYDYLWDVVARHADYARCRLALGQLLRDEGESQAALETLAPFLDVLDGGAPAGAYALLAEVLDASGRPEDAAAARPLAAARQTVDA